MLVLHIGTENSAIGVIAIIIIINLQIIYPLYPGTIIIYYYSLQVVLKNFNLILPPGKMVALCGLSGGGMQIFEINYSTFCHS